nr:MAG TPA: hypothetical protein [Caudoviricetes sp.]
MFRSLYFSFCHFCLRFIHKYFSPFLFCIL